MKRSMLALLMLLISIPGLFAATAVEATADVDRTSLKLGETVRYTLTIKRNGSVREQPVVTLPSFEGFSGVGNYSNSTMTFINGNVSYTVSQAIDLAAVKSGEVTIGPAKIAFIDPQTKQQQVIETKAITITVGQGGRHVAPSPTPDVTAAPTPAPAAPDIRSIKTSLEFRWKDILPFIILAVILVVILGFTAVAIFRKPSAAPAPALEEDFRKEAARRLRTALDLKKSGEMKDYYYSSYEAVRYFLSKRFAATMDELTTQEIAARLREKGLKGEYYNRALSFMKECDLVKFADYKPTDEEAEGLYVTAGEIINTL